MIEFLLENGADANGSRGKYLPPALCISVSMQYEEAVELLLKFGADANVADSDGFTPLANCAEFNFSSMAQKIIQSGG